MSMCKHVYFPPENLFAKFVSFNSTSYDDLQFYDGNFSNSSLGRYDKIQITFGGGKKVLRRIKCFSAISQSPYGKQNQNSQLLNTLLIPPKPDCRPLSGWALTVLGELRCFGF